MTPHDEARDVARRFAELALEAARLDGCTCSPEILTTEITTGVWDTQVGHENTCPLMCRLRAAGN